MPFFPTNQVRAATHVLKIITAYAHNFTDINSSKKYVY